MRAGYIALLSVWLAAMLALTITAPRQAAFAFWSAFAVAFSALWVHLLVPKSGDVLGAFDATSPKRTLGARGIIVLCAIVVVFCFYASFGSNSSVPLLSPLLRWLLSPQAPLDGQAWGFVSFAINAVFPGALLMLLGLRPRQLGLSRSARGTLWSAPLCLLLPGSLIALGLERSHIGVPTLAFYLVMNFFQNGFSEEFMSRGVILSHLRALVSTDWAVCVQALLFSLFHVFGELHLRHNLGTALIHLVASDVPFGLAMAFMALRTRSLLLPTVFHVVFDSMANAF